MQRSLDAGELVEILPDWTRPAAAFHAVYPPNRHPSARLRVFLDWLASRFGERRSLRAPPAARTIHGRG